MHNIRTNPDGYTLSGYIKARDGFWDAMEFTYRPCTHAERVAYEDAVNKSSGEKKSLCVCEAIFRHLKTWNEVDDQGKPIRITKETIGMMKNGYLVDRLYNIITGWETSDERIGEAGAVDGDPAALIDSLLTSTPPGVLLTERAEKN